MITYKTTPCRGFVMCVGSGLQNDVFQQDNQGDGIAIQYAYAYKGHGTVTNGVLSDVLPGKELLNLDKYMGTQVTFTMLGDPTMWIAINPVPDTARFDAELHKGPTSLTVSGADKRKSVVCLEGEITCNDVGVQALKYVSVKNGTDVTVQVPQDAVALVLTVR